MSAEARRSIDWARAHARPSLDRYRIDLADALLDLYATRGVATSIAVGDSTGGGAMEPGLRPNTGSRSPGPPTGGASSKGVVAAAAGSTGSIACHCGHKTCLAPAPGA